MHILLLPVSILRLDIHCLRSSFKRCICNLGVVHLSRFLIMLISFSNAKAEEPCSLHCVDVPHLRTTCMPSSEILRRICSNFRQFTRLELAWASHLRARHACTHLLSCNLHLRASPLESPRSLHHQLLLPLRPGGSDDVRSGKM